MNIFILEDNKWRLVWFKQHFVGHHLDIASHVDAGEKYICNNKYDIIFLDHDLDDEVYVDSNHFNTGYQLAKIILDSINKDTPVIVHSMNFPGAQNILSILKHGVHRVYGTFDKSVLNNLK